MKPTLSSAFLSLAAALALALPLMGGCSNDMEPKECDKLRGEAFDLLNKAQHCDTDKDCVVTHSREPICSRR